MYGAAALKRCRMCEREKPLDDEHFHRDVSSGDGHKHICKQCRATEATYEKEQIIDDAFERLQQRGVQQLQKLTEGGSQVPHAAEVYQCIMEAFGGPRLFAQQLAALYFHPNSSQVVKAKLLQTIISMSNKVSESGMITRDLETMSTESLRQALDDRMNEAVERKMTELRVLKLPPALPKPEDGDAQRVG